MEVATIIANHYQLPSYKLSVTGEARIGDIRHNTADLSFASKSIGFFPKVSIAGGMQRFLEWADESKPESAFLETFERSIQELKSANSLISKTP